MKLSEDQLKSIAAWFAGGASLDEIQKRLVAEYGVHLTYFDLRMIVAELPQPEENTGATSCAPPEEGEAEGATRRGRQRSEDAGMSSERYARNVSAASPRFPGRG